MNASAAEIVSIVYKPHDDKNITDQYVRVPLTTANLIVAYGIEGDRKGGHPQRQINLMSLETLQQLAAEGWNTKPGAMGEQLVVRGLYVEQLPAGTKLKVGEEAVLEIVKLRTGCDRLERFQGHKREDAAARLGVIARVVRSGPISQGDPVRLVQ